ncbi:MerR family transcriptional regulator [Paraclostridium sordellii]|uniref:MerR family transcriptional regulator n=1 Tax=Paraclostridium sordellii TaxID=1505 RepID=UPI0005425618|nr:MerR family transcriptional regulator [Paeniclostridium sordellii]MBX9180181.1 MerR family transcriptional regulator [Paeniclostridium sordellii]MCQ4696262.1 MerR family transcriptional regulator [Paeniclostridium sordellii]MDU4412793.1 MerR family transcriptional regulator [Paeniclostridium sordellii]MRZ30109.1 MerR family transcriptional regulator [Paeniclostridium sordellii]CEK35255.1 MerR family transcriptional regulator,HTH-type transcriptional regulator AdhR,zinc-responsive transcript
MNYSIAQAAKEMNLTTYTLRYYDREGLLTNVKRDKSGKRIFTKDDMEMLSLICCLKNTGMPIKEIKQFIDWQNEGNKTLHNRNNMLKMHKEDILNQIENLKKYLRLIDRKLDYYHDACHAYDTNAPIPSCCAYTDDDSKF